MATMIRQTDGRQGSMMESARIDPTLAALACALRVQYAAEPAAVRAVDRALESLAAGAVYTFTGTMLRVSSTSRPGGSVWHETDGERCSCESHRRSWCRHRALFRMVSARYALAQPSMLRSM